MAASSAARAASTSARLLGPVAHVHRERGVDHPAVHVHADVELREVALRVAVSSLGRRAVVGRDLVARGLGREGEAAARRAISSSTASQTSRTRAPATIRLRPEAREPPPRLRPASRSRPRSKGPSRPSSCRPIISAICASASAAGSRQVPAPRCPPPPKRDISSPDVGAAGAVEDRVADRRRHVLAARAPVHAQRDVGLREERVDEEAVAHRDRAHVAEVGEDHVAVEARLRAASPRGTAASCSRMLRRALLHLGQRQHLARCGRACSAPTSFRK